ncbi:SIR2 family NAD-dependent protein deacylase [Haloarchaeobius sp. DFWS5]|uniref:SIR2 family NAD-dependent protein deacylase n=1 Tax=Haloarchaeobius sp. DFWS5 TaxID=3446114 RepID=UPI003EC090A5
MDDETLVADAIDAAETTVALTGAGLSTASGIPDFRSDDGIWQEFDQDALTIGKFRAFPGEFWADWLTIHNHLFDEAVQPNPAHEALADLETAGHLNALLTQNVDGLHARAGSEELVHLHGTGTSATCQQCSDVIPVEGAREQVESGDTNADDSPEPPTCDCGGTYKPDTVLFGEQLPMGALPTARQRAEDADVFIAAGSSLTVEPVASLPRTALRNGATLVVVNLDETQYASEADIVLREPVEAALPTVVDELESR